MTKPLDKAQWIWDDGDPKPVNAYRYFLKEFDVQAPAELRQTAHLFADSRYELIVNGQSVATGPAPSGRGGCSYDNVSVDLRPGRNRIILVISYIGVPVFFYHAYRAGVIFEMGDIVTNKSWLVSKESGWLPSHRLSKQQGFGEIQDTRLRPAHVYGGEIDAQQWTSATEIAPAHASPWPRLDELDIPQIASSFTRLSYRHLIGYGNSVSADSDSVAVRLENEDLRPLSSGAVELLEGGRIKITPGDSDIWLLIDMGREVSGTVDVSMEPSNESGNFEANAGAVIDFGYDEALHIGETPSGLKHANLNDQIEYADRVILGGERSSFAGLWPRAFRYIRFAFRGLTAPIVVASISVREKTYPADDRGIFTCSEPRLDQLFEIGRRTLRLCMEDHYMDCPWRERAQWVADARIEAVGALYNFGDTLLHRRFLRQSVLSQHPDGRIDPVGPGDWEDFLPNEPIPGFTAIFVLSALDYYEMTADTAVVAEIMPALQRALDWMKSFTSSEGGLLADVSGWNFTDWAPGLESGKDGITAGVNLFYLQALRAASKLAACIGHTEIARSYAARADLLATAFDRLFWNASRGVYVNSVIHGEQSATASQQINTLAVLCSLSPEDRRHTIVERICDDDSLTQIGSPYFSYYLVQALASCDKHIPALNYIRKYWGAMMDAGATSWWETWDGKVSRCHAWSIAPSIWLPQHVLGVTSLEPGFACISVAPKPCDLAWARGIVPIPQGDVCVLWLRTSERFTLDVSVPIGVKLRVILPCPPTGQLVVNGEPLTEDLVVRRSLDSAELAVQPGTGYRFEVLMPT